GGCGVLGGVGPSRRAVTIPASGVTATVILPVCIVDDDPFVCDSLSVLLEAHGFATISFGSGIDLLADERRQRLGCLVVDYHMPGMDGLATLAALRGEGLAVPAVLITGRPEPQLAQRALPLGVIGTLEKPFAAAALIELVRDALTPHQ